MTWLDSLTEQALARELGEAARFMRADVSVEADVAALIEVAVSELGGLDCLFNNAGILGVVGSLLDTSRQDWDRTMAVLVTSVFLGIKHSLPLMRKAGNGGSIVNMSSVAGLKGSPILAAYCATKGALLAWSRALAVEFARQGIRVNAVCPGPTDTAMLNEEFAAAADPPELPSGSGAAPCHAPAMSRTPAERPRSP